MAYSADRKPLELTALTSLASDDTIIVGDTSDVSEVAKSITKANLVTDLSSDFATAAQGALADSATQPGDNISTLVNDAGYLTAETDDQTAAEVPFTPAGDLVATDVQAALEELDAEKLGVDALNANLILYPTTTASDIGGYVKLASNIADPDYDATAANVSTGAITTTSQLISSLASEAGIIEGELGVLNNTVIGNIRRTAGSGTATFYFEAYKRSSGGTETLLETSANTLPVSSGTYVQFSAAGLINNGPFLLTDRIVLKFYGNRIAGGSDPTYDFQFGGDIPTRALFPLPLTAVPTDAHNELSGLQGGTTDEYYHLTAAEKTVVENTSGTNTGDQTNISGNAATVTTNANLTGPITSVGNATTIADAELSAIAGLTSAADRLPYFTGSGTAALATFTSAARSIMDDASVDAIATTLGLGTGSSPQFTAVNIGNATDTTITRTAAGTIAVEGNVIYRAGGTDVPVTDGGTGASDAATARTNLGAAPTASPTFTGTTATDLLTYDAARGKVTAGGNLSTTETITFNDETNYTGNLDANITFTFASATSGDDVTLYLTYSGAQRTITWPTITWLDNATGAAPTTPAASGDVLVVTVRYIGTTYYASATGNYAVYA